MTICLILGICFLLNTPWVSLSFFMPMKVRIVDNLNGKTESLNDSDADLVATLIKENTKAVNQGEYSEAELEMLCAFATPETIQQEVAKGFLVLLFSDEGNLIGCALVMKKWTRLFIRTIQISEKYGGKGYGTLIYQHCEERFRTAGIQEIEVQVTKFPSSEAFYRKHGFVKTGNPTQKDLYFAMYKFL